MVTLTPGEREAVRKFQMTGATEQAIRTCIGLALGASSIALAAVRPDVATVHPWALSTLNGGGVMLFMMGRRAQ